MLVMVPALLKFAIVPLAFLKVVMVPVFLTEPMLLWLPKADMSLVLLRFVILA